MSDPLAGGPLVGDPSPQARAVPSSWSLFTAFLKIGVLGFGGVAAWARHVLVVERRLMDQRDFAESFGLASTLPGANTVNLSVMLGDRFRGVGGAMAAILGLLGAPLVILILLAMLYARFGTLPDVKAALYGAAAAAAGVVLGTSLKILGDLEPDALSIAVAAGVAIAAIAGAPMLAILLVAVPLSVGVRLLRRRVR